MIHIDPTSTVKFSLGQVVITANAKSTLNEEDVSVALSKHIHGDWGDVCEEDHQTNEDAVKMGDRLLSVYHDIGNIKFWIITEANRSSTTVLLPDDY